MPFYSPILLQFLLYSHIADILLLCIKLSIRDSKSLLNFPSFLSLSCYQLCHHWSQKVFSGHVSLSMNVPPQSHIPQSPSKVSIIEQLDDLVRPFRIIRIPVNITCAFTPLSSFPNLVQSSLICSSRNFVVLLVPIWKLLSRFCLASIRIFLSVKSTSHSCSQ